MTRGGPLAWELGEGIVKEQLDMKYYTGSQNSWLLWTR